MLIFVSLQVVNLIVLSPCDDTLDTLRINTVSAESVWQNICMNTVGAH